MTTKIKSAFDTLNNIRDSFLEECCIIFGIDDIFTEYGNHEWNWATESAKEKFITEFDDYNNWIFEDDYSSVEEWEKAKKEFALKIINNF